MTAEDSCAVFEALEAGGATVRFVGGCVRDAVLGTSVSDLDVATDAPPDKAMELLAAKGIRAQPTGIEHGTVTAIPDDRPFQITTLRRDVETDGRRAVVRYTRDWAEDAARRDFTINALSASRNGSVYDYEDGLADLENGVVRFIGSAHDRVAEDYLRILRFFRFHARFARGAPDPDAVAACREAADQIETLSGERVWQELSRMLISDEPARAFGPMDDHGILRRVLDVSRHVSRLQALASLETMIRLPADPIRRLTALVDAHRREASLVATRLRLGRVETDRFASLSAGRGQCGPDMAEPVLRRSLYRVGPSHFRDLLLLDWADAIARNPAGAMASIEGWKRALDAARNWVQPEFPVNGEDAISLGLAEGPDVGECLDAVEEWWIERAFSPDREACLDRLSLAIRRR